MDEPPDEKEPQTEKSNQENTSRLDTLSRWKRRPGYFSRHQPDGRPDSNSPNPDSPRTPLYGRSLSSSYNSPGTTFKPDDEIVVLEFGARSLRAGFGGESFPRCRLDFGPDRQRRAGNYSTSPITPSTEEYSWGRSHELWRHDLRDVDLELVSDRIERAVREAFAEYLLVMDETKRRKMMALLPSTMPHPLLSTLLRTLFGITPAPPSVTLLSAPMMCTVSAGLRSALVLDIGWAETTATAVYEYRQVRQQKSSCAMKRLSWRVRELLSSQLKDPAVSFEEVEEVVTRMTWCRKHQSSDDAAEIHLPVCGTQVTMPFSAFAEPVESVFFGADSPDPKPDDHELALHTLVYELLLHLSTDVRNACLPRIIVTGGGSNIPGLKGRLITELDKILAHRGWDPVGSYGSANKQPRRTVVRRMGPVEVDESVKYTNKDVDPESTTPTHLQPELPDPFLAQARSGPSTPRARCVSTLGAWSGASLVAGLRLQGLVEVDRERFLQHGLLPQDKDDAKKRQSVVAPTLQTHRQSLLVGGRGTLGKTGDGESASWSLGVWA